MQYINRTLETTLLSYASKFSAVAVTGPRQSGKSTLLKHSLTDFQYISFDDLGSAHQFIAKNR